MNNSNKLITGLGAVVAFGATFHLGLMGFPTLPLYVAGLASSAAIALIVVEWSQV